MNKKFKIIIGFLLLSTFFLNFYLLHNLYFSKNYYDLHKDHYAAIEVLNELYLSSRQLDHLTKDYITTRNIIHYTHYVELLNQLLGLSRRETQNINHAETKSFLLIIQDQIINKKLRSTMLEMYEQLNIQTNFQRQALSTLKSNKATTNEILNMLNSPIYNKSLNALSSNYYKTIKQIPHVEVKPSSINFSFIFSITIGLFFFTLFCLFIYLYKQGTFNRKRMNPEEYIKLLVNSMPFVSAIFNTKGEVIGCNDKLVKLLDLQSQANFIVDYKYYLAETQDGMKLADFIQEKNALTKQNNIASFNFVLVDAHGQHIPCQVTALYFSYNEKNYYIYYVYNSQKELEMQEKIREQEERIKIMFDSTPLCCTIWDNAYNLIDCNLEAARLFNFPSKKDFMENYKKTNPQYQPDGQLSNDKQITVIRNALINGYESFEWLHQDVLNNTPIPCHVILHRFNYHDKNIVLSYSRDLREEKKIFDLLKKKQHKLIEAKQKSEREAKAKSEFLAVMSHEIRTPLNAIINIFGFLSEIELDEKNKNFLEQGISSANILLHTVNDILDYSKIESGQLAIEQIPFSLNEMIHNITNLFVGQASKKNIGLAIDRELTLEDSWVGDPMRITQILINLISNAFKFTNEGIITLKIHKKNDKINDTDNSLSPQTLLFEVIDTGIGISPEQIEKIFSPFVQADRSTTRKYGGTGLGLSISKRIAELMNGQLSCSSELNKGSTFTLEIPLEQVESHAKPTDKSEQEQDFEKLQGLSVLLVEDNKINTIVATELLKKKGIIVDTADNGYAAIEKAASNAYDIILMDIQMPQMDGITATKKLKQEHHFSKPIIAMTANVLEKDKQCYMKNGFDAHLGKPIIPAALYELLLKFSPEKQKN